MTIGKSIIFVGLLIGIMAIAAPNDEVFQYTALSRADIQSNSELAAWYERTHRQQGVYSMALANDTYVLASAGAKPTGGYSLTIEEVSLAETGTLKISVQLLKPGPTDMVTQAFTYPNVIVKFPNQTFETIELDLMD